jgi:hypothetical protein
MTRVLFWNLDKFKETTINDPSPVMPPGSSITRAAMSVDRRTLMYDTLLAADPDIIVIVEVAAGKNKAGRLANDTGGVSGGVYLLDYLRNSAPPALRTSQWRLVPPLWIAGKNDTGLETVLVLFRGERDLGGSVTLRRYFTGPDVWSGGPKGSPRPSGSPGAAYGNGFGPASIDVDAMLVPPVVPAVPPRTIPIAAKYNGDVAENTVCARFVYTLDPVALPPTRVNFGTATPPLMASFFEDDGTTQRNLSLFAVHAPSQDPDPFIQALGTTPDIIGPLGANETRVVGGDFNQNLLTNTFDLTTGYQPLTNAGYSILLTPSGGAPADTSAYKGYFGTQIRSVNTADLSTLASKQFLWSASAAPQDRAYYPGYNYFATVYYSLDNILVHPARMGHDYRTTVMNYVVGAPYDRVANPPGNPPEGSVPFATGIHVPGWPQAPYAAPYVEADALTLVNWDNYGRMHSLSDHLPVFADV